jgi:hypothetical protein
MELKEMLLQFLQKEGFCPEEDGPTIFFKCEGRSYLFIADEDDQQYFRLMMPNIFDVTDENRDIVLSALNTVNSQLKVVKLYTPIPTQVWIGFEILLDSTPVLSDIVPRGISMLRGAQKGFYEAIEKG